jgi:alcohol dehydrogenase
MLAMLKGGKMKPQQLIAKRISLEEAVPGLMTLDRSETPGISVITTF